MAGVLYEKIEFCRSAETLWGKLESGRWDWLGVHPDGQFVLGSPAVSRFRIAAVMSVSDQGANKGEHGVGTRAPLSPGTAFSWYRTREDADAEFDEVVDRARDESQGPGVVQIRQHELIESSARSSLFDALRSIANK
jgi:hypothetical protein